jgi:ATP-dependent DNA helicase RecG
VLPLPSYKWEDPYLVLTLYRDAESVSRTLKPEIAERLSDDERRGWEFLNTQRVASQKLYSLALNVNPRVAQRQLQKLIELGLVKRVGAGRATVYEIIPQ